MSDVQQQPVTATAAEDDGEDRDYSQKVKVIAEKGIYEFEFVEGAKSGERIKLPRQKISNRMMLELEEERAEYAALVSKFASNGKASITREERHQAAILLTDLYAKLAKYYFHIERADFDMMDWDSTKPNIDAAANVSVRGRPNVV